MTSPFQGEFRPYPGRSKNSSSFLDLKKKKFLFLNAFFSFSLTDSEGFPLCLRHDEEGGHMGARDGGSDAAADLSGLREETGAAGGASMPVLSGGNAADLFLGSQS